MAVERQGLVLRADEDPAETGIDAIAEGEIDNPIGAAKINGRFRPISGQGIQPFPCPSREQDDKYIVQDHRSGSPTRGAAILARGIRRNGRYCWALDARERRLHRALT